MKPVNDIIIYGNDLFLDTGSPHYVKLVSDIENIDVFSQGRLIRNNSIFKNNGVLPKFIKIFRLPNKGVYKEIKFRRDISIKEGVDNPIFIRFVQDDGTTCWTSPAYFYR
jgi:hypothetical protein